MSRIRPTKLPPHLEERWRRGFPPGTKPTPLHELQVGNHVEEERREYPEPRWDLLWDWWHGEGDEEC